MKFEATVNDQTYHLELDPEQSQASVGDRTLTYTLYRLSGRRYMLRVDRKTYILDNVQRGDQDITCTINGRWARIPVKDEQAILLAEMGFKDKAAGGEGNLTAPMPGKILEVKAQEGHQVSQGDPLIILEAMKMENELKSPVDGTVVSVHAEQGASVEKNEILIEIDPGG